MSNEPIQDENDGIVSIKDSPNTYYAVGIKFGMTETVAKAQPPGNVFVFRVMKKEGMKEINDDQFSYDEDAGFDDLTIMVDDRDQITSLLLLLLQERYCPKLMMEISEVIAKHHASTDC